MKMHNTLLATLIFAFALTLGSCSGSGDDILATIPADASMIEHIDAEAIIGSAGCIKKDGKWELGGTLDRLCESLNSEERDNIEGTLAALPVVDAGNIYFYTYRNHGFVTCLVNHPTVLAEALETHLGRPDKVGGFKVYEDKIALRGNQAWLSDDIDALADALKSAESKSVADNKDLVKALELNGASFTCVINPASVIAANPYLAISQSSADGFLYNLAAISGTLKENKIEGNAYSFTTDGEKISMADILGPIDDKFTNYLPDNTLIAYAFGKINNQWLEKYAEATGMRGIGAVKKYFDAVNGTGAIAIAPPTKFDNILKLSEWTATIAVQYDKGTADQLIELAASLETHGMKVELLSDQLCVSVPGGIGLLNPANFFIGYFDGMLIASTRRIEKKSDSKLGHYFNGYSAAGFISLPADGDIVKGFGAPFGLKCTVVSTDKDTHGVLELEGSNKPFVESLISAFTDDAFQRKAIETIGQLQEQENEQ
ncbi:MAG: hypothetical protein JFR38_09065 [Muribaculaceae bacterium]|nr:hypothetical protein [Muribaculaceae bacterium]